MSRLAKREDCIGFLANHRLCKHPQSQLNRVYQRFIYNFSNTFPLHLILSSMVWYFQNKSDSIGNWSNFTVKQINEAQYAYGYICLLLEKHMAMRERTISWKFKYNFEWWINKRDSNSWKYLPYVITWNKPVVYFLSFTKECILDLLTVFYERLIKAIAVFAGKQL